MTVLTNNAEAGTNTTTVTTGNSGGDSGTAWDSVNIAGTGAITFDNTHTLGNLSYKVVGDSTNNILLTWSTAIGTVAEAWGRVYLYLTAAPATTDAVVWIRNGSSQVARVRVTTAGKLDLTNAANTSVAVTSASVALNQWVCIEWRCKALTSNGIIEAKLYNNIAYGAAPTETIGVTNAVLLANLTQIGYGRVANTSPNTQWMDFLGVSTTGYMGLVAPTTRIGQITVTGNATSDARVRVGQATLTGVVGSLAAVQLSGVWLSGVRPPAASSGPTPFWVASGGQLLPLYAYQANAGTLV